MRISDWISDVCSSDLIECRADVDGAAMLRPDRCAGHALEIRQFRQREIDLHHGARIIDARDGGTEIFRQCRRIEQLQERSEEHTSELQSLMRISYAVFCLKKKTQQTKQHTLATTLLNTQTDSITSKYTYII